MITGVDQLELERAVARGLAAFAVPPPQTLDEWACEHFYLGETTYVEQHWKPWIWQRGIMSAISNDDIREISFKKSARVGYTRMLLAAIGYFAHHKRRNQIIWQPTDDDSDEFVKADLDVMLRDVACMSEVLPTHLARHKNNTLHLKRFLGSVLYTKGGKAAKNYRRISADVAYLDELSAFDADVEKEGSPYLLAAKRTEGATFPKIVCGSTPKLKGFCQIEERFVAADVRMRFQVPCAHCGKLHALTWGGKDQPHGFKWTGRDASTVRHMCPHCHGLMTQADFLRMSERGMWVSDDGALRMDHSSQFYSMASGEKVSPPSSVALSIWTAYNPTVIWGSILEDFWKALELQSQGKTEAIKTFTNVTLGECWEDKVEGKDSDELRLRAEPFPRRALPRACLLLLCGGDTQDNRLEFGVWGYGRGGEMWSIDHQVFFGNPTQPDLWVEAEDWLRTAQYPHANGMPQSIYATAIDSGGHHTDAVYAFAHRLKALRVHAIKGASQNERSIDNGNTRVGYRWNGRIEKHGPVLWHVGTNLAKDRFHSRLEVRTPGPGYVHLSADMDDEWFKQLAGEQRVIRRVEGGSETRWTRIRQRIEVKDCVTYAIWLEERLDLWSPRRATFWDHLEATINPVGDLFSGQPDSAPIETPPSPVLAIARRPAPSRKSNFATSW